ncbi:MAG: hypothetical protein QXW02_04335, partial [Nitrososphaerota archaeon]
AGPSHTCYLERRLPVQLLVLPHMDILLGSLRPMVAVNEVVTTAIADSMPIIAKLIIWILINEWETHFHQNHFHRSC